MGKGRSVRLYLAEGSATGIITAEIVNWTGHTLTAPRTRLEAALTRDELRRTGIYILYGDNPMGDLPAVYVGEGDDISARLRTHSKDDDKDYWDRFVAVTNKDMNLTKAHVKYLEGRLITLLREAKKADIRNKTEPNFNRLPEADISDMESFIEELQLVLPVIGVDFFRKPQVKPQDTSPTAEPQVRFTLSHPTKGISAQAVEVDGEFVVLAGSTGNTHEGPSLEERHKLTREQGFESGRLERLGSDNFKIIEDFAFSSPSAASVFLFGTSRNGRTDWLTADSKLTYGEWKERQMPAL